MRPEKVASTPSVADLDPLLRSALSNLDLNISAVFRHPPAVVVVV